MKLLEKIFIILAVIGLFLRVMMWSWGELFLTVSLPSLAVIYLLMSWAVFRHHEHGHHVFLSFLSGVSFCIIFIGILFKLMIWRGGNVILVTGLSAMVLFKLLGMILERRNAVVMGKYFKTLFLRYYIKFSVAFIILFVPYEKIVAIYHRDDPEYVRLYVRWFHEPDNLKYREEFFAHRREIFKKEKGIKEYQEHKHAPGDENEYH
ncbi:MAG TPA: hypothetical protein VNB90_02220 [Cytophagaceae bacterium]|nr:hypothetical protein [Cytophagaceae bacterium]